MLETAERERAARILAEAERTQRPIDPLTRTWPGIEVPDAYEIQRIQVRQRLAAGRSVRGHKVGLTSRAMQRMLGVDQPDFGHLLDDMFVCEGGTIFAGDLCQPRVEFELAFVLGETLPAPGCGVADVVRSTAYVAPAIEVIDSRIRDWKIALCDTIADNASSARVVLGPGRSAAADLDLRLVGVLAWKNGEVVESGASGAVLGNPALAVAWLANALAAFGVRLEAGHVILPGSCTAAVAVGAGDVVRAEFADLGAVGVSFA